MSLDVSNASIDFRKQYELEKIKSKAVLEAGELAQQARVPTCSSCEEAGFHSRHPCGSQPSAPGADLMLSSKLPGHQALTW